MQATKIQVRAKSRSGITSAAFRFDVASASKTAAIELEQEQEPVLSEGALSDFLSGAKSKLRDVANEWLQNFKQYANRWFRRHVKGIIGEAALNLTVAATIED